MESWQRLGDAPLSRVNHQAICLGERVYVFGGFNSQMFDVDYNERQIDIYLWDIRFNRWEQLPYPLLLKSWDCVHSSWGSDPIFESTGSIQPSLRFGHTVVAWRGRGWLFGGRMQQQVCSNQLYMFDPGSKFSHKFVGLSALSSGQKCSHTAKKFNPPCWAEVRGAVGSIPSARDGHSATVLENAMFIFGGFEDVFDNYDNAVYRLDFITWNWTRIEIREEVVTFPSQSIPSAHFGPNSHQGISRNGEDRISLNQTSSSSQIPLPRDFACLASHQGRIFLFGGRSKSPNHASCDVYDSAMWELIPLVHASDYSSSDSADLSSGDRLTPATCTVCNAEMIDYLGATPRSLFRILWEEETGNWSGSEFWATSPPRPCCLWKFLNCRTRKNQRVHHSCNKLPSQYHSRWSSGIAVWVIRHPGYGLQVPEVLLSQIINKVNGPSGHDSKSSGFVQSSSKLSSPYGRRSLSHWCYNGNIYIAFGAVRSQTGQSLQLHYQDVWRFNLSTYTWTQFSTSPSIKSSNLNMHLPSARRRAIACLYVSAPNVAYHDYENMLSKQKPRVFIFGGTQPRALNEKISLVNTINSRSMNDSSTSHGVLPQRNLLNFNWGHNRTQNEVLGLRRNTSVLKSFVSILCIQSNFDYNDNLKPNYTTNTSWGSTATNFYLILIIPPHLCNSYLFNSSNLWLIHDFIVLSNLFIVNYAELSALFNDNPTGGGTSNLSDDNDHHSSFIKYLQSTLYRPSTVPKDGNFRSSTTTGGGSSNTNSSNSNDSSVLGGNNMSFNEMIHFFWLAWLSLRNSCSARWTTTAENSTSQFHILFVGNCPTSLDCISFDTNASRNYEPIILKEYLFHQDMHGVILHKHVCTSNRNSDIRISSQLIITCLKSVVYILFEAVERTLQLSYSNCTLSDYLSLPNNTTYNDRDNCNNSLLAYKTFFTYSDIDMEDIESYATHVYIDTVQLNSVVTHSKIDKNTDGEMLSGSLSSSMYPSSSSSSSSSTKYLQKPVVSSHIINNKSNLQGNLQQTVASMLSEYLSFIQTSFHLVTEENNLLCQQYAISHPLFIDPVHLFSNTVATSSNTLPVCQPTQLMLRSSLTHFNSAGMIHPIGYTSSRTLHSSSSSSSSSSSPSSNSTVRVTGPVQYFFSERLALEILNNDNIFNFTETDIYTGEGMFTLNRPPHATADEDEVNENGEDDADDDILGDAGDEYDNGEDSTDSKDSEYSDIHCIPNIGVLSRGTESVERNTSGGGGGITIEVVYWATINL
ncbi:unnamed protein product [Heterobilharzia americana]|nr:unnamed protein product [Heterobilharzia americana]